MLITLHDLHLFSFLVVLRNELGVLRIQWIYCIHVLSEMDHLEIWHVLGMVSIRPAGDVQGKVNFALRTSLILHLVDIADGLSKFFEDSDHLRLSV